MKGRTKHEAGGVADYKKDESSKPERRNNAPKIENAAEERKNGGRTARKHGGMVHHEAGKHLGHAKHVGLVHGGMGSHHAGRKARKSGGGVFSAARSGKDPAGHKTTNID